MLFFIYKKINHKRQLIIGSAVKRIIAYKTQKHSLDKSKTKRQHIVHLKKIPHHLYECDALNMPNVNLPLNQSVRNALIVWHCAVLETNICPQTFLPRHNLELPVIPTCMRPACERGPQYLDRTWVRRYRKDVHVRPPVTYLLWGDAARISLVQMEAGGGSPFAHSALLRDNHSSPFWLRLSVQDPHGAHEQAEGWGNFSAPTSGTQWRVSTSRVCVCVCLVLSYTLSDW